MVMVTVAREAEVITFGTVAGRTTGTIDFVGDCVEVVPGVGTVTSGVGIPPVLEVGSEL